MSGRRFIMGWVLALTPWAGAQTTDPATRELIERLLARIDTLEKRVAQLENSKTQAVAPATPAPVTPPAAAPAQTAHEHDTPPPTDSDHPEYPTLKVAGFSDFNFAATDLKGPSGGFGTQTMLGPHTGFQEGQFVLHMSSALSSRVSAFGELSMTARSDAGTGTPPATGFNVELERLIVRYDVNDYLKVSFGRYHTPINYWNTAYHHGTWLQTSISRPEMTQFGGSFIPVHFVGMLVEGAVPAGGLNLNYNFGLGNGRGQVISRSGDIGDINNNRAWLVNTFIKPSGLYGLQLGGSVYRDMLNPLGLPAAHEWIQSGHVVWMKESPEVMAEFANVTHQPVGGSPPIHSQAFYVQTAYRLPGDAKAWKPYYRFEYMHIPQADAIFRGVPSFQASTMGMRYDITTFAAFKFEYRHYIRRNLPSINGAFLQTSFTF
jgi:hypothetical protein